MNEEQINVLSTVEVRRKKGRLVFENISLRPAPVMPSKLKRINRERKNAKNVSKYVEKVLGRRIGR